MKLHTLFGGRRLAPDWSFTASHVLWRFLVSGDGMIVGEDRDTDAKSVTFFCIDMRTGTALWRDKTFGEPWWTGIEALVGPRLYLHGFAKPDMPEHHGLTAIELRTGAVLWSNPEISFYAADDTHVIGFRDMFERRVFEQYDAASGAFLGELASVDAGMQDMRNTSFGRTDFVFPEPLQDDEQAMALSRTLFESAGRVDDLKSPIVEYARVPGRIAFSAHVPNARTGALTHVLAVADESSAKELYRDTLNADTPYPVADSFFIDNATLYYIKEKHTLVSLPLA
jgi:hypothetical protein